LTGVAIPVNPPSSRLAKMVPPTLPGALEAPTTATAVGASSGRSEATVAEWSRSAIRSASCSVGRMSSDSSVTP